MTAAEARMLTVGARGVGVDLAADALGRLGRFLQTLDVWNHRIRLTGNADRRVVIEKHVIDSLAAVPYLPPTGALIDVGSGAGFPGIVLACARSDRRLTLLEPRRRRASFLREVIRSIPLPAVRVLEMRAEDAAHDPELVASASLVISRAIRLDVFLPLAYPLLAPDGEVMAMQTPGGAAAAGASLQHGLSLARRYDYVLPDGAARTILTFTKVVP